MIRNRLPPFRWFFQAALLAGFLLAGSCQAQPARIPVPVKVTITPTVPVIPTLTRAPARTALPTSSPTATPTAPLLPTPAPQEEIKPSTPIYYDHPQRYRITYIAALYNDSYRVDTLQVYQPRPQDGDSQREVTFLQILPPAEERSDPEHGNGLFYWDQTRLSGNAGQQDVILQFETTIYETHSQLDGIRFLPYDTGSSLYSLYTRTERYIEADDPQIRLLVSRMAAGEPNPYRLARKFYEYIIKNAAYYSTGDGVRGASHLARKGWGDCSDYAALFVAFCRAAGIPARPVVGYWAASGLSKTHVWAEFYIEGIGWLPVDPNMGQAAYSRRNDFFGNMDNKRIIFTRGFNIQLDPPLPGGVTAPLLQVPWLWFTGSGRALSIGRVAWGVEAIP